jgi:ribokinase
MTKQIVVVGSTSLDFVAGAGRIPVVGETIIGNTFNTFYGGKGANQAVAAAKLGYPTAMIARVGDDAFGPQLQNALKSAGVDAGSVLHVAGPSGIALIMTGGKGENSIIVVPGSNGKLTIQELQKHENTLKGAGMFLAQLEIPMETVEYLAEFADKNGIPLMLDPAPARELPASLLRRVSWITPNESETLTLLRRSEKELTEDQVPRAAEELLSRGVRDVALKLGGRGCLVAHDGKMEFVPAYKVEAVDTTAAGDAFNGAFAVGLMKGQSPREAATFACAVAGISVTRHGAQPSMPTAVEVEKFLRERRAK